MAKFTIALFSAAALFASSANASIYPRGTTGVHQLLARQSTFDPNSIPAQCKVQCSNIINTLNTCDNITCLCNAANADALSACITCFVGLSPVQSTIDAGDQVISTFNSECAAQSVTASITVPTSTGSVTGSATGTAIGTGSSTASRTTISAPPASTFSSPAAAQPSTLSGTRPTSAGSGSSSSTPSSSPSNGAVGLGASAKLVGGLFGAAFVGFLWA